MTDRIGTHGVGCETWGRRHYECALRRIEELQAELALSSGAQPLSPSAASAGKEACDEPKETPPRSKGL